MHSMAPLKSALQITHIWGIPYNSFRVLFPGVNLCPANYLKRNKIHSVGAMHLNELIKSNRLQL